MSLRDFSWPIRIAAVAAVIATLPLILAVGTLIAVILTGFAAGRFLKVALDAFRWALRRFRRQPGYAGDPHNCDLTDCEQLMFERYASRYHDLGGEVRR